MISRRHFLGATSASLVVPQTAFAARGLDDEDLIKRAMEGIDPKEFLDAHVHVVGIGQGATGCAVHPDMMDFWGHPMNWIRFRFYAQASGVKDLDRIDESYLDILRQRTSALPHEGRSLLMAFDQVHDEQGIARPQDTIFHVPNAHMFQAVQTAPNFLPCASVHPYLIDAVEALHHAADQGAIAIKWLPNAMWIDPASPLCDKAYAVMAARGLTLISHGGEEQAVPSADTQEFGNPLRLRRALDAGVQVVVAHCASHGVSLDIDQPSPTQRPAFELFLRMMDDPQYEGRLFGEISAVLLLNRVRGVVPTLLRRTELHHRLIHGSDYPIPGIDPLINLFQLWSMDLIRWEDRAPLSRLFDQNPILGDFVLKRVLTIDGGPPTGFPPSVFCPGTAVFPLLSAPT
jgi:predicted TIM-barrel fold metal-dependent hydrolase